MDCITEILKFGKVLVEEIAAIGITNQKETTILWSEDTGDPDYNTIVWQCYRNAMMWDELKSKGYEEIVLEKTGLTIDAYFFATKIN